jgi:hypothetical protein
VPQSWLTPPGFLSGSLCHVRVYSSGVPFWFSVPRSWLTLPGFLPGFFVPRSWLTLPGFLPGSLCHVRGFRSHSGSRATFVVSAIRPQPPPLGEPTSSLSRGLVFGHSFGEGRQRTIYPDRIGSLVLLSPCSPNPLYLSLAPERSTASSMCYG